MSGPWGTLEQIAGAALVTLVLLDVFVTVLYARVHSGYLSQHFARLVWHVFDGVSSLFKRYRPMILAFSGPVIVVSVLAMWALLLIVGSGMIYHPELGRAVQASHGATPAGFIAAMYAAGYVTVGAAGDITPRTPVFRLLFVAEWAVGMSLLSMTISYLMQIYTALLRRNELGLKLHLLTGSSGDAAELVARIAPCGRFEIAYNHLLEAAAEMTSVKEGHQFYPVLFYFRFREPYYSVSRTALVALDSVTLMRAAFRNDEAGWIKNSGALCQFSDAATLMVKILEDTFLHGAPGPMPDVGPQTSERWRARYEAAAEKFRGAGIHTVDDQAGGDCYVELRSKWDPLITTLAPNMAYTMEEIDPVGSNPPRRRAPSAAAD
jgi:hypothetical protein